LGLILFIAIIILLIALIIPQLIDNVQRMVYTLPSQLTDVVEQVNNMSWQGPWGETLQAALDEALDTFRTWLRTSLLPKTNDWMTNITSGVINVVTELFYFIIGLIVSVYVLYSKERFVAGAKKATYAVMSPESANTFIRIMRKANDIYSGFIAGKIVDSAIIGVLCFLGLSLINIWVEIPYLLLVSVVVGVTNVIPFFGPYLGAVPCFILIVIESPLAGLIFLIFILVLQQLDGNVIGPKILGDSTGLSAFWVIFAILLGGGLFGVIGMVLECRPLP